MSQCKKIRPVEVLIHLITIGYLLFLLLSYKAEGAESIIVGRDEVIQGQFFVLDATQSIIDEETGEGFWIDPPDLPDDWVAMRCDGTLGSSITLPNELSSKTYYFHYVSYDKDGSSVATHALKVKREEGGGPSPPTPPLPSLPDLTNFTKSLTDSVKDPETAKQLAEALESITPRESLESTEKEVSRTIEKVIYNRENRDSNWFDLWRVPLQDKLETIDYKTSEEYLFLYKGVIEGLKTSSRSQSKPTSILEPKQSQIKTVVYTTSNCAPCRYLKDRVAPNVSKEANLVFRDGPRSKVSGPYPRIFLYKDNKLINELDYPINSATINQVVYNLKRQ